MRVRRACADDWLAVETLCQGASRTLPRMWRWEEYLGEDLFVVVEQTGTLVGAFLVWPDDSPVAWVRLAVLGETLEVRGWLDLVLPPVLDGLHRRRVRELAWMDCHRWAAPYLRQYGFSAAAEVVTLIKFDRALPPVQAPDVHLRTASQEDAPEIAAVDRAAFASDWWYSEDTIRRRICASPHFTVAELSGGVVAYADAELYLPQAHINRIAVHPSYQGHRVGTHLLRDAITAFWEKGAQRITLNTQADNHPSRRLYRRLGFQVTGERVVVWKLQLGRVESRWATPPLSSS